jgi:ribosomal protein L7Ae-like RNA K-turn-binding protein
VKNKKILIGENRILKAIENDKIYENIAGSI